MNIENILKEKKGTIVDVRTPAEFSEGNVSGSINIPLHLITVRLDELKSLNAPLILCCASGGRSAQAHQYLSQSGLDCHNAGSWRDVDYLVSQIA